jgi:hypothetical protein
LLRSTLAKAIQQIVARSRHPRKIINQSTFVNVMEEFAVGLLWRLTPFARIQAPDSAENCCTVIFSYTRSLSLVFVAGRCRVAAANMPAPDPLVIAHGRQGPMNQPLEHRPARRVWLRPFDVDRFESRQSS